MCEGQADRLIDIPRADVGDLVSGDVGDVEQFGHGGDELLYAQADGVAGGLRVGGALRGDCAAGGEDRDIGEVGVDGGLYVLADEEVVRVGLGEVDG